ncbi:zinc ribbon domain-containing protein [Microbacterium gorillae]|uniref:zinc ribbon domain-containing protein n=1 Tax=Microbacterium gorillae TaxID=1231063 RepID=UPI00058F9EEC|nr:C4-type zinc ribbon domain-containing protein [Microbacterium gorillae]
MKASPQDQRSLLDVADIDRRLVVANAQRTNPPQVARIHELQAQRQTQTHELTVRAGARDDIQAEIARVESDVNTARTRLERDEQRLTAASAKEAVALENEIASLRRRMSSLEDTELEAMERLEAAEAEVEQTRAAIAATNEEGARLSAEAKELVADATTAIEGLDRDRAAVLGRVPEALSTLYDRIARNGVGAGLFRESMCNACRVILTASDVATIRSAADDEVLFCPECGAILVRTEDSGL